MASTSTGDPSSENRNWVEMPDEIMGGLILQRLDAIEIVIAERVCRNWRRICKDPEMWKTIDLDRYSNVSYTKNDLEELIKQAVHRSRGELIDIRLKSFGTDDLLDFISGGSRKLTRLRLTDCFRITGCGLINALKRLPHLETLELSYMRICPEDVEVIGHNCPLLKSFTIEKGFGDGDGDGGDAHAHAIANSMPALRHLKLGCITMKTNDGIRAILNGCSHLESLDLRLWTCTYFNGNLEKLCRERIKDFKFNWDNISASDEDSDMDQYGLSGGQGFEKRKRVSRRFPIRYVRRKPRNGRIPPHASPPRTPPHASPPHASPPWTPPHASPPWTPPHASPPQTPPQTSKAYASDAASSTILDRLASRRSGGSDSISLKDDHDNYWLASPSGTISCINVLSFEIERILIYGNHNRFKIARLCNLRF